MLPHSLARGIRSPRWMPVCAQLYRCVGTLKPDIVRPGKMITMRTHCLYCLVLLASAMPAFAQDAPHYDVRLDAKSRQLDVKLCLVQKHTQVEFAAESPWAMRFVHDLKREDGGKFSADNSAWSAQQWRAGECLSFRADLAGMLAEHERDVAWLSGDDVVSAPQMWLLLPDVQGDAEAQVTMHLPAGWDISTPWHEVLVSSPLTLHNKRWRSSKSVPEKLVASSLTTKIKKQSSMTALFKTRNFIIPNTPSSWSASVAFGRFHEQRVDLPGGELRVSILHGADAAQRAKLHEWMKHVSRAILSAYGQLPVPYVQVLIIPVSHRSDAVVFGEHTRGEGNSLHLLVNPDRPLSEFMRSWIPVHELSHLMHPYLGDRGSWLAEGLATYFQNVLRARAELITPQDAWDELHDGFERGQDATHGDPLAEAAADMHHTHDYARIYWSGAAYWLTVDRDLRRESGGKLHVDTALSRFHDCCLPASRAWKPEAFVAKLDELLGVHTFSRRYREFADMKKFPDWKKVFIDLGVKDIDGKVSFDAHAPDATLRDDIMAPLSQTSAAEQPTK